MYLFDLKGLFGKYKTFAIEPDGYCRVAWRNRRRRSSTIDQNIKSIRDQDLENLSSDVFQSLMNGEFEESFESQKWAEDCFRTIQDVEEFECLMEMCSGDADFSAISTSTFMKSISEELKKIKSLSKEFEEKKKEHEAEKDEDNKSEIADLMDEIEYQIEQTQKYASVKAQKASLDAIKKVKELDEAKSRGFFGFSEEGSGKLEDQQKRWDLINRFNNDRTFQMVMKLAGRIQKMGDDAIVETTDVPESFEGFTSGNNFDGLQLEDLTMMNDDDLENLFWADYCDENLLVDLFKGTKKRCKGDIVVCSDISTSMNSKIGNLEGTTVSKHQLCRAFVFAAMVKCKREDRKSLDISFNHAVRKATEDPESALNIKCGGNTNFDRPLRRAIKYLRDSNTIDTADVIFVTDGECSVNVSYLQDLKDMGVRLWLYSIADRHNFYLEKYAHRSFLLSSLDKSMEDLAESIKDK